MSKIRRTRKEGVAEAMAFQSQFPLSDDPNNPLVLHVRAFDQYGFETGEYPTGTNGNDLPIQRARLKGKINLGACKDLFILQGGQPFQINVHVHGEQLVVLPVVDAHESNSRKLPSKVQSIFETKRKLLSHIYHAIQHLPAPPAIAILQSIRKTERVIDDFGDYLRVSVSHIDRDVREIENDLRIAMRTNQITGTPGMMKMIEALNKPEQMSMDDLFKELFPDGSVVPGTPEAAAPEDNLPYDVMEEAEHLANKIRELGVTLDDDNYMELFVANSRFYLEDGFTDEELQELYEAVVERLTDL